MRFRELEQFFGGYFHQDWPLDHDTPAAVVDAFIVDATGDERDAVAGELRELLRAPDEVLGPPVAQLGAFYDPTADGLTVRGWLNAVLQRLTST